MDRKRIEKYWQALKDSPKGRLFLCAETIPTILNQYQPGE